MGEEKRLIYLDNAATTKTAPEVAEAMLPYFSELYGNPSSVYSFSQKSREAITKARETIAKSMGAKTEEIYFTAGGSVPGENILLQQRLSIMRFCIPQNGWKNTDLK